MVQVDVFWSFGIGASFAAAAAPRRTAERKANPEMRWHESPWFSKTLLFLSCAFAPAGVWLLWSHTSWETMHVAQDLPGWLVALFALTNVTQGILGFWLADRLIAKGQDYRAWLASVAGFFGMYFMLIHGWDGTGYKRLLSSDRATFQSWTPDDIWTFLGSDTAVTLGILGLIVTPWLVWVYTTWPNASPPARRVVAWAGTTNLCLIVALIDTVALLNLGWFGLIAALIVNFLAFRQSGIGGRLAAICIERDLSVGTSSSKRQLVT